MMCSRQSGRRSTRSVRRLGSRSSQKTCQDSPRSGRGVPRRSGYRTDPHWFGLPPPPHVWEPAHVPQSSRLPHPSPVAPQLKPRASQVIGLQVPASGGDTHAPATHVSGDVQLPQASWPPQPSPAGPQWIFSWVHVSGTHPVATPASTVTQRPARHTAFSGQTPHWRMPPQPSPAIPQSRF